MIYENIVNNPVRRAIGNFLNINIANYKYIYLDLWSVVHLFSGGIVYFLIDKYQRTKTNKFLVLFLVLLTYELIEFVLYKNLTSLFIAEGLVDVAWDLIVGMMGGGLFYLLRKLFKD